MKTQNTDNKLLEDKVIEKLGRHAGVAFMSAIGFKCTKTEKENCFSIEKTKSYRYGKIPRILKDPIKLGVHHKKEFVKIALENGYNPAEMMNSGDPEGKVGLGNDYLRGSGAVTVHRVNNVSNFN